jgi:hypothetical protein
MLDGWRWDGRCPNFDARKVNCSCFVNAATIRQWSCAGLTRASIVFVNLFGLLLRSLVVGWGVPSAYPGKVGTGFPKRICAAQED